MLRTDCGLSRFRGESEEMCNTEKDCLQGSGATAEFSGVEHGGAKGAHSDGEKLVGREHGRRPHRHLERHAPVSCLSQTGGPDSWTSLHAPTTAR